MIFVPYTGLLSSDPITEPILITTRYYKRDTIMSVHKTATITFSYEELLHYQEKLNKALANSPIEPFSLNDLLNKVNRALAIIEEEL